jgi:hypothetical protein
MMEMGRKEMEEKVEFKEERC